MDQSAQQQFLADLDISEKQDDVLQKPLNASGAEAPEKEETAEEQEMKLKNRRERRLAEKWQHEREANIALNARLETISESQKLRAGSEEADYLKLAERIYGNDEPGKIEATNLLKQALQGAMETAKKEALQEFEKTRGNEAQAIRKEEQSLDDISDRVEDEYGIDMSSETDRKGYFSLLEKLSPKDGDGNIIEYADPDATAELYLSRKEKASSRAKELASRSMTRSGASQESKLQDDAATRFLKENGII